MRSLTSDGQQRLSEIARRHGVSEDAARSMLTALSNGGGTMAQFSHPEFGGSGQWMRGGMTMVSDLFNNALKATVDNLCNDLSNFLLNPPMGAWQDAEPAANSSWQQQRQGDGSSFGTGFGGNNWWPAELGMPNSSGAQNDLRYAYFQDTCRLAVEIAGALTVYDTADHRISGVSQQQGNGWTLTFTSQYGTVPVSSLRVVDSGLRPAGPAPSPQPSLASVPAAPEFVPEPEPAPAPAPPPTAAPPSPESFAGTVWSFGESGSDAASTLTLATDGGIAGGDARVRYWSAEDGTLTFYDTDGRSSVAFALPASGATAPVLPGHDPARPDRNFTLRPQAQQRDAEAPSGEAALPVTLTVGDWTLEDNGGNRLGVLRLLADGRVEGGRGSEAKWRIKDHGVDFLHGSGRPTSRFDTLQFRAGRWTLIGAPLNNESAVLFLKQS
ncbi:hypothetical protein MCW82_21380 [Azospirillum doebereinerae]|uniref:hypothetical protein n=1 Tax=Azospirillum doebereinerae TaxID=92933 RepID=UPI001EE5BB44|nr:hypothetical protein [Azospirillum doebereinerae]MCG5242334.1 hypothetical protein [Azospirillum doebereinerae]